MIRMQLLQPHTHAGLPREPGDVIEVDLQTADWLAARRIARALNTIPSRRAATRDTTTGDDDHE